MSARAYNGGRATKKLLAVTLVCILLLSGCARTLDDVIENEPSIVGVVIEEYTNMIRIAVADGMEYYVSLDVELEDSMTDFSVGDEVAVYYDGVVYETYPAQLGEVYAILLITPADRSANEQP